MEPIGKDLVEFWSYAADKGLLNSNTASTLRAACSQVLMSVNGDDWETTNIAEILPEQILTRFQNLRAKDFKPDSLRAYARRFKQARDSYLDYLKDPSNWKYAVRERSPKSEPAQNARSERGRTRISRDEGFAEAEADSVFVIYPFPVRKGMAARLSLPIDLTVAEAKRLCAFISTLAVEETPANNN